MIKVPIRPPLAPGLHHTLWNLSPRFEWIHFRWAFSGVESLFEPSRPATLSSPEGRLCHGTHVWYVKAKYFLQLSDPYRGWYVSHVTTGSLFFYPLKESLRTGWRKESALGLLPITTIILSCQPETRQHRTNNPAARSHYLHNPARDTCQHSEATGKGSAPTQAWTQLWDPVAL